MIPRGIRNNNPGNIRHGDRWRGLARSQSDPEFCVFDEMRHGLRALLTTLRTYHDKHGLDTVRGVISRWAPPNENDTNAYITHVCTRLGVLPDAPLHLERPTRLRDLAAAITRHECGRGADDITDADWDAALALLKE